MEVLYHSSILVIAKYPHCPGPMVPHDDSVTGVTGGSDYAEAEHPTAKPS